MLITDQRNNFTQVWFGYPVSLLTYKKIDEMLLSGALTQGGSITKKPTWAQVKTQGDCTPGVPGTMCRQITWSECTLPRVYNSGEGPWGCCTFDKLLDLISFLSFLPVMIGLYQLWYKPESFERRNTCARLGCGQTCGHFLERCGRAQLTVSSVTPGQMCYYEQWFWSAG